MKERKRDKVRRKLRNLKPSKEEIRGQQGLYILVAFAIVLLVRFLWN